jgi:pterin-4a-carbinolamine dehydratase
MTRLSELGFKRCSQQPIRFPVPHIHVRDLSPEELEKTLSSLPGWRITISDIPGHTPLKRSEVYKVFEFSSFEDAIEFMQTASGHISEVDHHPRWENIWRTVTVWLSTWDIGHKVSRLDLELAQYFEALWARYLSLKKASVGEE